MRIYGSEHANYKMTLLLRHEDLCSSCNGLGAENVIILDILHCTVAQYISGRAQHCVQMHKNSEGRLKNNMTQTGETFLLQVQTVASLVGRLPKIQHFCQRAFIKCK